MAFHLHRTVEELAEAITYSQFLKMLQVLGKEKEWRAKQEFYWAQIAAETRKGRAKFPNQVKVTDMILVEKNPNEEAGWEEKMEKSIAVWGAALGPTLKKVQRN